MEIKTATEWAELYETAIENLVTDNVQSYSVAGRTFTRLNLTTLERLYNFYAGKAAQEKHGRVTHANMSRGEV